MFINQLDLIATFGMTFIVVSMLTFAYWLGKKTETSFLEQMVIAFQPRSAGVKTFYVLLNTITGAVAFHLHLWLFVVVGLVLNYLIERFIEKHYTKQEMIAQ